MFINSFSSCFPSYIDFAMQMIAIGFGEFNEGNSSVLLAKWDDVQNM